MLSMFHCTAYKCLMNGSNSLSELDREPEWLCPVCLKKLQWNVGLDVRAHYQQQRALFESAGFRESMVWADRRSRGGFVPELIWEEWALSWEKK